MILERSLLNFIFLYICNYFSFLIELKFTSRIKILNISIGDVYSKFGKIRFRCFTLLLSGYTTESIGIFLGDKPKTRFFVSINKTYSITLSNRYNNHRGSGGRLETKKNPIPIS